MIDFIKKNWLKIILAIIVIALAIGWYLEHSSNIEIKSKPNVVGIEKDNTATIQYTNKTSANDSDIEIQGKSNVSIKYNNKEYQIPTDNVQETHKFENGKLVIDKQEKYTVDLTNTIDNLAEEKAKKYSRVGKADFGAIYNSKDNNLYGGIRYNAKAYDIGYYHSVSDNNWMVGVHYKF